MKIPLLDLTRQYASVADEADKKVIDILHNAQYILGQNNTELEEKFKTISGAKYSIACGNGTDALAISLKALGVGPGDEVITTPFTFFASSEAIRFVGATPVFVDVKKDTYNIDPDLIEEKITSKTKAILVVHIFGNPAEMDKIMNVACKHNLKVVEDAAQAVNSEYKGQKIGSIGDIACFSFFPTKNLGACGDAGMITTNDEKLFTICRALRVHGSGADGKKAYGYLNDITMDDTSETQVSDNTIYNPLKYYNYLIGHNSRTDEIQAAILNIKLKRIDEWTDARRKHAYYYNERLKDLPLVCPKETDSANHVYHLYILQSEKRGELVAFLNSKGISTGIYYPVPLHLQYAFSDLGYTKGDLPIAEYLSERTFAIPLFPELKEEEQNYIIDALKEFYV